MNDTYRAGLHNAPVALSALQVGNHEKFREECAARHIAYRDEWLRNRELPFLNRLFDRIGL